MHAAIQQMSSMRRLRGLTRGILFGSMIASMLAFNAPASAQSSSRCDSCGTVVTTNRRDEKGSGTAGTVVGGVGGAVAGNVIGHNTTSTVIGGIGGAVAGNLIGKKLSTKKIWAVEVKMDRGGTRNIDYADRDPGFHQGDRVRVTDRGLLQRI
jgi:outer membrane lipoprotein SlyB